MSGDLMLALEISLMSTERLRDLVDEVTDMGATPTARQAAAAAELRKRTGDGRRS